MNVAFDPTVVGQATSAIGLETTGGDESIGLAASAGTPGDLQISSIQNDLGTVAIGSTATDSFSITNTGGTNVTITKSKPPFGGEFAADTTLPEGDAVIGPGASVVEQVTFTPQPPPRRERQLADQRRRHLGPACGGVHRHGGGRRKPHRPGTGCGQLRGGRRLAGAGIPRWRCRREAARREGVAWARAGRACAGPAGHLHRERRRITRFTLTREVVGRREGGACVRPSAHNRDRRSCIRYVTVATFSHSDTAGVNHFAITVFVRPQELAGGVYRLRGVPGNRFGAGPPVYLAFRVGERTPRNAPTTAGNQFCAPPKPLTISVIPAGLSMICEKRTTVTVSSALTSRP